MVLFKKNISRKDTDTLPSRARSTLIFEQTMPEFADDDFVLSCAAVSDIGVKRKLNEDSCAALYDSLNNTALLVVADGMGGHSGGEVASAIAAAVLEHDFRAHNLESKKDFARAYHHIDRDTRRRLHEAKGGTTCVTAVLDASSMTIANIGDSRAYLFREGRLKRLTKDDSLVQTLVDSGKISDEEALSHPKRNVILKALGTGRREDPTWTRLRFMDDDLVVLCSDGLCGVLADRQLEAAINAAGAKANGSSLEELCESLIARAIAAGSTDNITVALCQKQSRRHRLDTDE